MPTGVRSGKNSEVFAGPRAEFFRDEKIAGHEACYQSGCLKLGSTSAAGDKADGSEIAVVHETPNGAPSVYLAVIAPDKSDKRLLVIKEKNGDVTAANPENKKHFLWICW